VDRGKVKSFAVHLMQVYGGGVLCQMIDLGARTGLLDALAQGPATSIGLAERAGLVERYVREWLGAMVTGGVVEHDPDGDVYTLPAEHAVCLTGDSFYNTTAMARLIAAGASRNDRLATAFREGGGIRYTEQPRDVVALMDALGRARYDTFLVDTYLATEPDLQARLRAGADVLDVGCGAGHATNLIAEAFPGSRVVGLDSNPDAIAAARREAATMGLGNVRFEVADATELPPASCDVVTALDVVHDLPHPSRMLAAVTRAMRPDGWFVMYDSNAPARLQDQAALPWSTMMYGVSVNACLTHALADGGEGLGPMWGRAGAEAALTDAGLDLVGVHDLPGDPMNALYVARTG
jgi:SAM-dependent methyltransferase